VGQNMDTVVLGNVTITSATPTMIKVWTSLPNGVPDIYNTNDTIQSSFQASQFLINAASDSICVGANAMLSLSPNTGYSAGALQWQTSTNGTTWTDIPNTDNVNYTESN